MLITVGGSAASGKTTLAMELARRLKFKHISAGGLMRVLAAENNMDLIEFSKYAESHPEVDFEVDRRQKKLANGDCVVDGRLSAHFLKASLRVWLTAPIEVRARRIRYRDKFKNIGDAVRHIRRREASERVRYRRLYGIDHPQLDIYNLILDTGLFGISETVDIVEKAVECLKK